MSGREAISAPKVTEFLVNQLIEPATSSADAFAAYVAREREATGVLLRKFGQEVIRITAGKRVHGTGSVPGGVNKLVTPEERDLLDHYGPQYEEYRRQVGAFVPRLRRGATVGNR